MTTPSHPDPTATIPTPTTAAMPSPDGGDRRGRRRLVVRTVAGVVAFLLVGTIAGFWFSPIGDRYRAAAEQAEPVTGVTTIEIADSNFLPASVAVPAGTRLTWEWTDGEAHDVVFTDGPSSAVQADGSWSRDFGEPGEYLYSCTLHLFMDGRVVVTP